MGITITMEQQRFEQKTKLEKKVSIGSVLSGLAVLIIALLSLIVALIAFRPDNRLGAAIRSFVPIPVVVVDGTFVAYRELDRDRESLRRFYESQSELFAQNGFRIDFGTDEGKRRILMREKDILNKLVEDRVILKLARERGIMVTQKEVRDRVEEAASKDDGSMERLNESLSSMYGWTLAEFEDRIVRPSLYQEHLEKAFDSERDSSGARKKIEDARAFLREGHSFEETVAMFSDGASKERGGDLGVVEIPSLMPEMQVSAKTQEVGIIGDIVESSIGYHILLVARRDTGESPETVSLKQIFVAKPSFSDWITEEKRKAMVLLLPRRYIWSPSDGMVEFRDEGMRNFEEQTLQKSDGDPSILF